MSDENRRLVYSTDGTLPLPKYERAKAKPMPAGKTLPPADGAIRVGCEKRRGGLVTLVYGLGDHEISAIASELRKACGTGGTAKDGIVSLQGDKRDDVIAYFQERGRRTKRMGG